MITQIAQALGLRLKQVEAVIKLSDEGATIPFIARYRKELTDSLDEVAIAGIIAEHGRQQELEKRREAILKSLESLGVITPKLEAQIKAATDLLSLEDLYLPYKPKRKTRASVAKSRGLEPLAAIMFKQEERELRSKARAYLQAEVPDVEAALAGARDIVAEWISEKPELRQTLRRQYEREALLKSKVVKKKQEEGEKYRDYFDFEEPLNRCKSHRILALFRAEEEGFLRLSLEVDSERALDQIKRNCVKGRNECSMQVIEAAEDAWKRLLAPSLETEMRQAAKERADREAIAVFAENLRQLLFAPPLGEKGVLAIDPGFRTGCKVACLDASGELKEYLTIYPHSSGEQAKWQSVVIRLLQKYQIEHIAVGNGTAGRETIDWLRSFSNEVNWQVHLVNESGASIYSASDVAREEFPDLDLTYRGAVSIGRRLMDPLAELVKIDPKSVGVGQYQHDVNQSLLKQMLDQVVVSVVNQVGVNLNTASLHLLQYVSGIGPVLAKNILLYRQANGAFESRSELQKVKGLGPKAYQQAAGFLRVKNPKQPLDNTSVHPERYQLVKEMAEAISLKPAQLIKQEQAIKSINPSAFMSEEVGLPTIKDILAELLKPGLDPRGEAKAIHYNEAIKTLDDLREGMELSGVINNLTAFGAFVDLGIKENGLLHISEISHQFIKDPSELLHLGQQVRVRIKEIDATRKRISLTMKF